ncbi:DUF397 domain-containing protein [Nonomuraea sp. SYSU D8015]|uniref:DUF397 domain-containing protein n=1 Tax=Nonomuraea sp. SYSU D8015 TaxID=2593644 RepID=UPI0021CDFB0C|nr:DUF397 domain-containing protein [Nonomuraea sp. SYSU D8015]
MRDSKLGDASPVLKFAATDWAVFVSALAAEQLGTYGGPVLLVRADAGLVGDVARGRSVGVADVQRR